MSNNPHFELMADYNRWMNESLYAVCEQIADEQRKADRGAYFRSIHSTLNHILWGDRIWLGRFTGQPARLPAIGEDIYDDFEELKKERARTDVFIIDWVRTLNSEWLAAPLEFISTTDKKTRRSPAWTCVSHMFNHQTHHRGQVTTLVKQLGYEPPVTDIPWMPGLVEDID